MTVYGLLLDNGNGFRVVSFGWFHSGNELKKEYCLKQITLGQKHSHRSRLLQKSVAPKGAIVVVCLVLSLLGLPLSESLHFCFWTGVLLPLRRSLCEGSQMSNVNFSSEHFWPIYCQL